MKLFGVFFELSEVLYLYRDSVTVLAKIATTVTLMDKIKMEFSLILLDVFMTFFLVIPFVKGLTNSLSIRT